MGQVSTNGELNNKKIRGGYFVSDPEKNKTKMPPENSGEMPMPGDLVEERAASLKGNGYISNEDIERLKAEEAKRIAKMKEEIRNGLERKGINR